MVGQKNDASICGQCVWLLTSSQCLNQFAWFLAHFNAVLSTPVNCSFSKFITQSGDTWQKSPGFHFPQLYRNFSTRFWAEPVWTGWWVKSAAALCQKVGRWRPSMVSLNNRKPWAWWETWYAARCDGKSWTWSIRHQWMVTSSRMCFAEEWRAHQLYIYMKECLCSGFLIMSVGNKQLFVSSKGKTSSPGGATLH